MDDELAPLHSGTVALGIRHVLCTPLRLVRYVERADEKPRGRDDRRAVSRQPRARARSDRPRRGRRSRRCRPKRRWRSRTRGSTARRSTRRSSSRSSRSRPPFSARCCRPRAWTGRSARRSALRRRASPSAAISSTTSICRPAVRVHRRRRGRQGIAGGAAGGGGARHVQRGVHVSRQPGVGHVAAESRLVPARDREQVPDGVLRHPRSRRLVHVHERGSQRAGARHAPGVPPSRNRRPRARAVRARDVRRGNRHAQPGDFIVAFSDGVTEAFDVAGEEYSDARLLESIERHRGKAPQDLIAALLADVEGLRRRGHAERRSDARRRSSTTATVQCRQGARVASEVVEASGHLIDSGILNGIFDTVIRHNASFEVLRFTIGRTNAEPSVLSMRVTATSDEDLRKVVENLVPLGCLDREPAGRDDAARRPGRLRARGLLFDDQPRNARAPRAASGCPSRTSAWTRPSSIDGARATCRKLRDIRKGDAVVCGVEGIRVVPTFQDRDRHGFAFMTNEVSSERRVEAAVDARGRDDAGRPGRRRKDCVRRRARRRPYRRRAVPRRA